MKLLDLLTAVKEKNLTKQQLEDYHTELTSLYAQMMWEMADLEKKEAIYFLDNKDEGRKVSLTEYILTPRTDVAIKRMWRGTPEGQRLIELKNYDKATSKVLTSLKSRMYTTY